MTLQEQKEILISYLKMKTEQSDWKGVRKAAKELAALPPIPLMPFIETRKKPGRKPKVPDAPLVSRFAPQSSPAENASEVVPTQLEIPHHENKVVSLLKLSDEELVDKMFPDYTQVNNA